MSRVLLSSIFSINQKGLSVQLKKSQRVFHITLVFPNEVTRTVPVKASNLQVAEARALKRNPKALSIQRNV